MTSIKTLNDTTLLVPYTSSGRSHKVIILPNGILTLLVSDPSEDLASAAICVAAGAHNDPDDIAGLAHFCEHLLLLGSKNYPNTTEFHDLLTKAGGRRNAFTTGEQTAFFFEVPSDAIHKDKVTQEPLFNHLIAMFADSIKAPTFPEAMFEKEIYAIDNEHSANISKSGRAFYHGLRLISNPSHPFHRFATGNYFTLNDVPNMKKISVKDRLQKYYTENYVADKMTLVIRGSQSLNLLQKLAVTNFGDIQTSADRSQKKSKLKILSKSSSKNNVTEVKDFKDYNDIIFQDTNTLANYLFDMESIDILNYLHQDSNTSPMMEASSYAKALQKDMSTLKLKNILKGSGNWDSIYNMGTPEGNRYWTQRALEFQEFIHLHFSLKNMKILFMTDPKLRYGLGKKIEIINEDTDKYFNFEYAIGKFTPSEYSKRCGVQFKMIGKNMFIPKYAQDHNKLRSILEESSAKSAIASLGYVTKNSWSATDAVLSQKTESFELWTKYESSKVFSSKVFLSFDIVCTNIEASPLNTMNSEILAELFKLRVAKQLYSSELLGYTWSMSASLKGDVRFGFTVAGFTDGVEYLLSIVVDAFKSLVNDRSFTNDDFRKSRVAVRSRYGELVQNTTFGMAMVGLLVVLEQKIWELEERLEVLDDIDVDDFKSFLTAVKSGPLFLRMFVQGDFKSSDYYSITINQITGHLDRNNAMPYNDPTTILVPPGESFCITRDGPKEDPTSSVCLFIQTGLRNDPYSKQMTNIFGFLMSLTLVPDLRFKKQLGYVVLGGVRLLRGTVGLHITVMSGTFSPQYLTRAIDEYLSNMEQQLIKMSDDEFIKDVIQAYVKTIGKESQETGGPESLTSDMLPSVGSSNPLGYGESMKIHGRLRDLIFTDNYNPRGELDAVTTSRITKNELMTFFHERIKPASKSRASVAVMIKSSLSPEESRQMLMRLQLEAFLKMNGLRISADKLKELVEKSGGNPAYLMKDLFKHFMGQGESLRLCTVVLKEIFKHIGESMKHRDSSSVPVNQEKTKLSVEITDISAFQSQNNVVRAG
ncbi:putative protease AXL1 [Cyberlindnera fabianii]|uniref:Putative protease AXL1 n=1 Tax=Cyberlindnera fabianii TaxID=36022 RepID=A0A1V2KZL5_CYBFA|nr:putative protease AXL1 [Cyberlindnera fabianii]